MVYWFGLFLSAFSVQWLVSVCHYRVGYSLPGAKRHLSASAKGRPDIYLVLLCLFSSIPFIGFMDEATCGVVLAGGCGSVYTIICFTIFNDLAVACLEEYQASG